MTRKTRNFVVTSLLVLCAGVGAGFVAYFGVPTVAFTTAGGPEELRFVPSNATLVAYANVHEVMTSELRQRVKRSLPFTGNGQRSFEAETGINIETDIDRVVIGVTPSADAAAPDHASGLVVARGRFDVVRIETLLREKGATVDSYKGRQIFTHERPSSLDADPSSAPPVSPARRSSTALTFIEPGVVVVGTPALVRRAIDLRDGGDSVVASDPIMSRVRALETGNVWAVGRFDALTARANLAQGMAGKLPAITWFSASGQVDSGVRAALKAEARDEESATALRDLIRGFVALVKMQGGSRPEVEPFLQTLQLGGSGQDVTLSVDLSPQTLDLLTNAFGQHSQPRERR